MQRRDPGECVRCCRNCGVSWRRCPLCCNLTQDLTRAPIASALLLMLGLSEGFLQLWLQWAGLDEVFLSIFSQEDVCRNDQRTLMAPLLLAALFLLAHRYWLHAASCGATLWLFLIAVSVPACFNVASDDWRAYVSGGYMAYNGLCTLVVTLLIYRVTFEVGCSRIAIRCHARIQRVLCNRQDHSPENARPYLWDQSVDHEQESAQLMRWRLFQHVSYQLHSIPVRMLAAIFLSLAFLCYLVAGSVAVLVIFGRKIANYDTTAVFQDPRWCQIVCKAQTTPPQALACCEFVKGPMAEFCDPYLRDLQVLLVNARTAFLISSCIAFCVANFWNFASVFLYRRTLRHALAAAVSAGKLQLPDSHPAAQVLARQRASTVSRPEPSSGPTNGRSANASTNNPLVAPSCLKRLGACCFHFWDWLFDSFSLQGERELDHEIVQYRQAQALRRGQQTGQLFGDGVDAEISVSSAASSWYAGPMQFGTPSMLSDDAQPDLTSRDLELTDLGDPVHSPDEIRGGRAHTVAGFTSSTTTSPSVAMSQTIDTAAASPHSSLGGSTGPVLQATHHVHTPDNFVTFAHADPWTVSEEQRQLVHAQAYYIGRRFRTYNFGTATYYVAYHLASFTLGFLFCALFWGLTILAFIYPVTRNWAINFAISVGVEYLVRRVVGYCMDTKLANRRTILHPRCFSCVDVVWGFTIGMFQGFVLVGARVFLGLMFASTVGVFRQDLTFAGMPLGWDRGRKAYGSMIRGRFGLSEEVLCHYLSLWPTRWLPRAPATHKPMDGTEDSRTVPLLSADHSDETA